MVVRSIGIMINFIVCEDNDIILNKNIDIINKVMFNNNISYKIYKFSSYNSELKKLIKEHIENKIYILDIELDNKSGIDIAREIRNNDLNSFIIISTVHSEYLPYTIKSKLLIFDFVSKFDDYENSLSTVIKNILSIYDESKILTITINGSIKKIKLNDILKIEYNNSLNQTSIKTKSKTYYTKKTLKVIEKNLDDRFIKTKDGKIINNNYIIDKKSINKKGVI